MENTSPPDNSKPSNQVIEPGQGSGKNSLQPAGTGTSINRGGSSNKDEDNKPPAKKPQAKKNNSEINGGKVSGKVDTTNQYSIHRFIISDPGTIGVRLSWLPKARKCIIHEIIPDSIAQQIGLRVRDELLAPPNLTSLVNANLSNLFKTDFKSRPILFEIKCKYMPPTKITNILLPQCYALHRFTINKSGPLRIRWKMDQSGIVHVKEVT